MSSCRSSHERSSGSPDATFGSGGKVVSDLMFSEVAGGVAVQAGGRLIVVGTAEPAGTSLWPDFALAAYRADGSLDPAFGTGGKVTTDFARNVDRGNDIAVQRDGKLVAVGLTGDANVFNAFDFGVVRYNPNGSLDPSFG